MDTRHVFIFTIRTYRNIKNILVTVGDFYMQTNDKLITELMMDIYEGKTQLPDFQRGWVWEDGRIQALIASITNNYPIGAAMFLESTSWML